MTVLADPNDVCLNTFPFSDFSQSLGTMEERLESSLSMLVYVFVAAVHDHASHFAFSDMLLVLAVSSVGMSIAKHLRLLTPCTSCTAAFESRRCRHRCSSC